MNKRERITTKSKKLCSDHDFISVVHYHYYYYYYYYILILSIIFASSSRHNPGCPVLCHFAHAMLRCTHIIILYYTSKYTYFNNINRYVLAMLSHYILSVSRFEAHTISCPPPPGHLHLNPLASQSDNPGVKFTSPAAAFVSHFIGSARVRETRRTRLHRVV